MGQVGRIHSGIVLPPLILSLLNQLPVPLSAVLTLSLVSCHSCNICQQRKEKRKLYLERIQTNGQENMGVGWAAVSPWEAEQCSVMGQSSPDIQSVPLTSRAVEAAEECRGQRTTVNWLSSSPPPFRLSSSWVWSVEFSKLIILVCFLEPCKRNGLFHRMK